MASTAYPQLAGFQPVAVYGPLRDTLTIAARTLTNTPSASTQVLWSYSLVTSETLQSLDLPVGDIANRPTTWQLAVVSENDAGDVSRYVLIPPQTGEILWPRYEGQTLENAITLEIWSVAGQATANVTETVITLGTYIPQRLDAVLMNSGATVGNNTTL